MKIWPIITLVGLIYGSTLADPKGVGHESNPHPHRLTLDAEVAADFDQPHRVATFAYREYFAKLLQDGVETSDPQHEKASAEAAQADADDGQDPGKKLFWTHTYPGVYDPDPFPGWGDPNAEPDHPNVAPTPCSSCRPDANFTITYTYDDPAPPKVDENMATTVNANQTMGNLPFGALKAISDAVSGGGVSSPPCALALNGLCVVPCTTATPSLPSCDDKKDPPVVTTTPLGGLPVGDPVTIPPIIIGGGSAGGVSVGGVSVGGVPEPSTWMMLISGFGLIWIGYRRQSRRGARLASSLTD